MKKLNCICNKKIKIRDCCIPCIEWLLDKNHAKCNFLFGDEFIFYRKNNDFCLFKSIDRPFRKYRLYYSEIFKTYCLEENIFDFQINKSLTQKETCDLMIKIGNNIEFM